MKFFLDSNIWIKLIRQELPEQIVLKLNDCQLFTSRIVLLEIADVFIRNNKKPADFIDFITTKSTDIPLSNEILISAAQIKKKQRKTNSKFGIADASHYVCAQHCNAILLTSDFDYEKLANVEIIKT